MRKNILLITLAFLAILSSVYSQSYIGDFEVIESNGQFYYNSGNNNYSKIDTKHIILKYVENTLQSTINTFEQTNNLSLRNAHNDYYIYIIPDNVSYISYCQSIEQASIVNYIEISYYFELHSSGFFPDDYDPAEQWYLDRLNLPETWILTKGNENVKVAVIDTGLEFDDEEFGPEDSQVSNLFHNSGEDAWDNWWDPDTQGNVHPDGDDGPDENTYIDDWQGLDLYHNIFDDQNNWVYEGLIDNDVRPQELEYVNQYNPYYCQYVESDHRYHGTWISSIIAAKTNNDNETAGMAGGDTQLNLQGISILPIKVMDWYKENGCFKMTGATNVVLFDAIEYAMEMQVDIINLSLGTQEVNQHDLSSLQSIIHEAYQQGILIVASAGNDYSDAVSFPASEPDVISVGATKENEENAVFSNEDGYLELMAPGVDIETFDQSSLNGTSMSAAMVSATAALMKSVNNEITNVQMRDILRETTFQNSDYDFVNTDHSFGQDETRGWNEHLGFGRINTLAAVCAALDLLEPLDITNNNELWDEPTYSKNDIIIEPDARLTITSTLMMDPSAKIIVKPKGKLIIDGGTITNLPYCAGDNLKWGGIEVWGNPAESQQSVNGIYEQGYIELKNGATIENAEVAVLLGKESTWNQYTGGIIKAYDSHFINNAIGVLIYPYQNMITLGNETFEVNNEAYFQECDFNIDANYFTDTDFYKHVGISQVKGIRFRGCSFKRESTEATSDYCHAIEAYDAGLSISDYGTLNIPTSFEGFYCGIKITNNSSSVSYDSYINNSVFTNNSYGIKLNAMTNMVSITDNIFNVGYNSPDKTFCTTSQGYGIFLDNSNTFVIQDNKFYKYSQTPSTGEYIGIEAYNTQTSTDEIFSNEFDGLSFANHATNMNWWQLTNQGLAYYCNIQDNNDNDLYFTWSGGTPELLSSGVKAQQGSIIKSAGNMFSQNITPGNGYQIYNDCNHLVGYYCYFDGVNITSEYPTVYYTSGVTRHGQNIASDCSSGGIDPKSLTESEKQILEAEYMAAESDYNNVVALYESLEDGGDTYGLATEVSTSWPNDMWELRAELLGLSPYLSTEILKTAADKTEVLPESVIFEILSANPDELKKEELLSYLENKEQPLPEYMISILRQLAQGQSSKTVLLGDLSGYHREKSRIAHQMLVSLAFEDEFDYNEYRLWLNNLGGKNSDYKIVASFIEEGNYTDALALANIIPELYDLNENALTEHNYYMDMLNLDITWKQENINLMALDNDEMVLLESIAENSEGSAGAKARGILEHFYGQHFCNCINTTADQNKSISANIDQNVFAEAMGLKLKAEPNPATNWVAFNYSLPIGQKKSELLIRNTEGKLVANFQLTNETGQKVWDTRSLNSGTYVYEFICGELKQTGKIVIIK